MKKSCKNIDITDKETIKPFIYECLKRHHRRYKFARLLRKIGATDLDDATDKLARYAAGAIKDHSIPKFVPYTRERYDSTSEKRRLIGRECALQQVFDYIAVRSCAEIWKRRYVLQQCSSIKKRGQIYGVKMIQKYVLADIRAVKYARVHKRHYTPKCKYFVKLDVRHCYQSIDRALFMELFARDCGNDDILYLWQSLLTSYARADGCTGFLIGALPSQWAAQFMLSFLYREGICLDGVNRMVMFMDDMLLMGSNRRKLKRAAETLSRYAETALQLQIKPNWHIKKLANEPIDMMGFVIHHNAKITIRAKNFIHARRMLLRQQREPLVYGQAKRLASYKGYFKHSDCRKLRKEMKLKSAFEQAQQIISNHERRKINESLL